MTEWSNELCHLYILVFVHKICILSRREKIHQNYGTHSYEYYKCPSFLSLQRKFNGEEPNTWDGKLIRFCLACVFANRPPDIFPDFSWRGPNHKKMSIYESFMCRIYTTEIRFPRIILSRKTPMTTSYYYNFFIVNSYSNNRKQPPLQPFLLG